MKILLPIIILFLPLSVFAERICIAPSGCPINMETGFCENCIDKEKVDTFTPVVKVVSLTTTNKASVNTPTSHFHYGYPTHPHQNLLTSSIHR